MKLRSSLAGLSSVLVVTLVAGAASAQTTPVRIRGTIESLSGTDLVIASREGPKVPVKLSEGARTTAVVKATLADIKPGSYVGIAAMPRPDGSQMAIEVLIFPEAMRGTGEGHRAWDLMPESTMTNATVADTVGKVDGQTLTLTYKEGQKTVVVPAEAPIVTFVPAMREDMKPGVRVFTTVMRAQDGTMTTGNVVVGKDGIDPPM